MSTTDKTRAGIPAVDVLAFDQGVDYAVDKVSGDIAKYQPTTVTEAMGWLIESLDSSIKPDGIVEGTEAHMSPSFVYGALVAVTRAFEGREDV